MPFDSENFELARDFVAPHGTDPVLETLRKAREWLSDPAHWHKGSLGDFQSECGGPTCAWGAIVKVNGNIYDDALDALVGALPGKTRDDDGRLRVGLLPQFNDAPFTVHANVLALFDRAIAARPAPPRSGE